jgi:hypothetical protein
MNHPLLLCVLLTLGLVASLALFLALKHDFQAQAQKQRLRIDELSERLEEAWQREPVAAAPVVSAVLRSGLNLNRRVQALRMMRRGEDVSHIAAVLGVPRREIELLIRVQQTGKARAARSGS